MIGDDIMKRIKMLLILVLTLNLVTGCFKRDTMDDISIYTTSYPIYYLMEAIYGYNSEVDSIYPNGVNIDTYKLTEKRSKNIRKLIYLSIMV